MRPNRLAGLFAALLLAACDHPEAASNAAPPPVPEVGVYTVQAQPLTLTTDLPGRTAAFRVAEVRPQVSGILQKRLFTEGAEVKEGQQLYQIDAATYQAAYDKAQANLVTSKRRAERYAQLVQTGAVGHQDYDDAVATWKEAQAEVESARIDLDHTKMLSPISGRTGRSGITEGALVTNGQPQALVTIQQLDPIYVDVTQPVTEILRLEHALDAGRLQHAGGDGAEVRLTLDDGSEYPLPGTLKFSEVSVDQGTGSVTLRAVFPNPDRKLLPGMFVHAELKEGVQQNAKLVPQQAVTRDAGGNATAWVVKPDNTVELRQIETLRTVGNAWLVGKGIEAGERVVAEGTQQMRNGIEVKPVEATNVQLVASFQAATR
jgi:membrane fusion protein (multidrug efflux system)